MPYDTIPSLSVPRDRYEALLTRLPDEDLQIAWKVWFVLSSLAATVNFVVMLIILASRTLRSRLFNRSIVALALPDFVFSTGCSFTCLLHFHHHSWYGGSVHCDIQGINVVFGFAASMWMNAVIAYDLRQLTQKCVELKPYVAPTQRVFLARIAIVYAFALLLASFLLMPWIPIHANAVNGLACTAVYYSFESELWFWFFFMPLLLGIPVLALVIIANQTNRTLPTGFFILRGSIQMQELRSAIYLFATLLISLLFLWMPACIFIWASPSAGWSSFIGGAVSHLQAVCSGILYCCKHDVRAEILSVWKRASFSRSQPKRRRRRLSLSYPDAEVPRQLVLDMGDAAEEPRMGRQRTNCGLAQFQRAVSCSLVELVGEELTHYATTADCVSTVVKPASANLQCSYVQLLKHSPDALLRKCVGPASAFVSHSWQNKYQLLCQALKQRYRLSPDAAFFFYLDIFAINQHALTDRGELDELETAIIRSGHVLLVATPWSAPVPLQRVWCLHEIHVAFSNNVDVEICLNNSDKKELVKDIDASNGRIQEMISKLNVVSASASVPADRVKIFNAIESSVGFAKFNESVARMLQTSYAQIALLRSLDTHVSAVDTLQLESEDNMITL
eukprot:TRINITY_DN46868_c0_g1_i1.p1 TRINITY_DN46868_c0_g1~~TRINITY_DN46868_c0_g1_i1.p1  ORF type:complete len:619 (-),score=39.93 TRINITY_DN46868_c0_g1_i1:143-1999(-)